MEKLFEKSELIPAIVQENKTGQVLMLAYMNRESLGKTLETGYTWFYSRSRGELWNKGATSGHYQKVVSIMTDCDNDALLVIVHQMGNACHTGSYSCFFKRLRRGRRFAVPVNESRRKGKLRRLRGSESLFVRLINE